MNYVYKLLPSIRISLMHAALCYFVEHLKRN